MLLMAFASMVAGGMHRPAAVPVHPAKHIQPTIEQPGTASRREDAFLIALTPLLDVTRRPLSKEEVAKSLNVVLTVLRDSGSDGVTYAGNNNANGWQAEFFTVADRFNVSVSFRGAANNTEDVRVDRIATELAARGWTRSASITHPFLLESFVKDCREVRIEHDGKTTIQFMLLNVC